MRSLELILHLFRVIFGKECKIFIFDSIFCENQVYSKLFMKNWKSAFDKKNFFQDKELFSKILISIIGTAINLEIKSSNEMLYKTLIKFLIPFL